MTANLRAALLVLAACALTFMIGLAVGRSAGRPSPPATMNPDAVVARLTRELQLDSAQQLRIREAFSRHQGAIDDAWRAVAPHVRAAIDSTQMDILRQLRPDQRARFLEILRVTHPGMPIGPP